MVKAKWRTDNYGRISTVRTGVDPIYGMRKPFADKNVGPEEGETGFTIIVESFSPTVSAPKSLNLPS
jgi:hypothetical protein